MSLEAQITHGLVACIERIETLVGQQLVRITCTHSAQLNRPASVLTFTQIHDYREVWHDPDGPARCAQDGESLIGLNAYPDGVGIRYVITTEHRELMVRTAEPPHLGLPARIGSETEPTTR